MLPNWYHEKHEIYSFRITFLNIGNLDCKRDCHKGKKKKYPTLGMSRVELLILSQDLLLTPFSSCQKVNSSCSQLFKTKTLNPVGFLSFSLLLHIWIISKPSEFKLYNITGFNYHCSHPGAWFSSCCRSSQPTFPLPLRLCVWYVFERQWDRDKQKQRDCLPVGSLLNCLQQLELG